MFYRLILPQLLQSLAFQSLVGRVEFVRTKVTAPPVIFTSTAYGFGLLMTSQVFYEGKWYLCHFA